MSKGRRARRILIALVVLFVLGLVGSVGAVAVVFWYYGRDLQEIDEVALRNHRPPQVTRIYASDGETLIGEIYEERRTVIPYESIPSHVEYAFLAAEDADFYHHEGMDYWGMVRALVVNVRAGEIRQGASTITQQVVKNFILSPERTFERKVQELLLARRLEEVLSKQEILQLYLNEIYLGHGRYGLEEASRFYFGKSVTDIDLGQAAILASLPKAPSTGSPLKDPEGAKRRQVYVLEQMVEHGFAPSDDAQRYIDMDLDELLAAGTGDGVVTPGAEEFVDYVEKQLRAVHGDALDRLGATVITTVDMELQREARSGLQAGLRALDVRQDYGHGIKPARDENLARAREKGAGPLRVGEVYPVVIQARAGPPGLPPDGFPALIGDHPVFVSVPEGSRYDDPDLSHEAQFPAGGITMGRLEALSDEALPEGWARAEIGSGPQGSLLLADVDTGEIRAMIGGYEHRRGDFNRALSARRQPGSAFKPFVYGAALASGKYTAATLVSDSPEIYEKWRPTNYERDVYRGDIRLRVALTHSVNTVAIKLLDAVGIDAVHAFARLAGIESPLGENLSLALGTSEVTGFELLRGYLTLARGGNRLEPIVIREIRLPGERAARPGPRVGEEVLEPEVVYVLTSMMQSVVEEGTGKRAKALGRPVAGKTGTSADAKDAWFAGFTVDHVAIAWVGFDQPRPIGKRESGGKAALPIWLSAMEAASEGHEARSFPVPSTIVVRAIDPGTGLLVGPGAGDAPEVEPLEEFFVPGTEPTEASAPENLPAGDVLLDLYGGAGGGDDSGAPPAAGDGDEGAGPDAIEPVPAPDGRAAPDEGAGGSSDRGGEEPAPAAPEKPAPAPTVPPPSELPGVEE